MVFLTTHAIAHGEGVYSCNMALKTDFERSKDHPIPSIIRIVTAHYETDDIGVLAWWGPHNEDPQFNARIDSIGRGDNAIYREFGLIWKTSRPELIMRPNGDEWDTGRLFWATKDTQEREIGSFTCSVYLTEY